ncbi:hypothetical protein DPEC_G00299400 [Dallia pectoralis]|uniref:Uncharacterized protein n=1 Tax=Dallia pectoralis TaxID=75939 RepID=A0ACC2FG37_DALPE|nr:hypothetical protein DPEC_G00299400 [Dallia pectoralis]
MPAETPETRRAISSQQSETKGSVENTSFVGGWRVCRGDHNGLFGRGASAYSSPISCLGENHISCPIGQQQGPWQPVNDRGSDLTARAHPVLVDPVRSGGMPTTIRAVKPLTVLKGRWGTWGFTLNAQQLLAHKLPPQNYLFGNIDVVPGDCKTFGFSSPGFSNPLADLYSKLIYSACHCKKRQEVPSQTVTRLWHQPVRVSSPGPVGSPDVRLFAHSRFQLRRLLSIAFPHWLSYRATRSLGLTLLGTVSGFLRARTDAQSVPPIAGGRRTSSGCVCRLPRDRSGSENGKEPGRWQRKQMDAAAGAGAVSPVSSFVRPVGG